MYFSVDPSSGVPIYLQIVNQVRSGIALGNLQPGQQLPSVRDLAVRMVINPNTVQKAYRQLIAEGLLAGRQGRGVFVAEDRPLPDKRVRKRQAAEAVDVLVRECALLGFSPREIRRIVSDRLRKFAKGD